MVDQIANGIVSFVNAELRLKLVLVAETAGGALLCEDERRRRHAVVCYGSLVEPIVRGVIRERRRGMGFAWLCNGQAATNAIEIARWGEDHRYTATVENVVAALDDIYNGAGWIEVVRNGGYRLPKHLSIDDVISAKESIAA
jgi:hypothetical protein